MRYCYFDLLSEVSNIEIIAVNTSIRDIAYLRKSYESIDDTVCHLR